MSRPDVGAWWYEGDSLALEQEATGLEEELAGALVAVA
jgi:hypothetical protein